MKFSSRQLLFAACVIAVIAVCFIVLGLSRSPKSGGQVLSDAQLENPDAVIDIHLREFEVVSPSSTNFRVKHGSVTKLRFFVQGEEIQIRLTGKGVDINTESDETSALPGSIFVGGLEPGTYELAAYEDAADDIGKQDLEKHVIGRVEVVK